MFEKKPSHIFDIGGNTGKFALQCLANSEDIHITIYDLPGQLKKALANVQNAGFANRISGQEIDWLAAAPKISEGADLIWMSQFLDCFGADEVCSILQRVYDAIDRNAYVYILEPFWNNQRFPASRFCLVGTSMYFTCIANGNSKMYHSDEMKEMSVDTGFEVLEAFELIGDSYHTLLKLRKRQ